MVKGEWHWVLTNKRMEVAPAALSGSDDESGSF
jgi:hypothetical protein